MRILPSQSSGMKPNVGSTVSFTTSSSKPVPLGDRLPVGDARAAERIDADREPGGPDRRPCPRPTPGPRRRFAGSRKSGSWPHGARCVVRDPRDCRGTVRQQPVGALLDPAGDVGIGRPAVRRVVLETAVFRRIVRRRDHDAVGETGRPAAVVRQDGVRDDGGGRRSRRRRRSAFRRRLPPAPRVPCRTPAPTAHACLFRCRADRRCPADAGTRTSAWVMARTCASLNDPRSDEPRWPLVPKLTRCAASAGSGCRT